MSSATPATAASGSGAGNPGVIRTGQVLSGIATDKSRYAPGDTVTVTVNVTDNTGSAITGGAVSLYVMALQNSGGSSLSQPLNIANGASTTMTFHWTAPPTDYTGYLASAVATDSSGKGLDSINVGVDVSSSWARFPRYGYMTNNTFGNQSLSTSQAASIMSTMSNYHIDGLQFYDWQYNHDQPLCGTVSSPCASWTDDGNQRTVYASAVKNLVNAAHNANIMAMPYNAIFSADNGSCCGAPDYHTQGLGISPSWGVYQDTAATKPLAFFQWDYMDPSNPGWQQYLMGQENAAIQAFNFDGYHGDTFGDPDTVDYNANGQPAGVASDPCTTDTDGATSTTPVHNVAGSTTWLSGTFPSFLSYAKSALGSGKYLMFNPVTYDYAHCEANTSAVDLLYSELWPNDRDQYWDYNTLKQAVDQGFSESAPVSPNGRGKSLAVAAYVDFTNGGGGTFNTPDVLLLDSTLFASGGSHEELGDTGQMLDYQEYRAGATPMSASLSQSVQSYYDFMTAYENLLRDGQTNTSQTVAISGQTVSNQATPGDVWAFTKQDADHEIIQMINMVGQSSNLWQTGKCDMCSHTTSPHPAPTQLTDVPVKYYYKNTPKAVMFASPDYNNGTTYQVPFTTGTDSGGTYVSFTVPSLSYWDMVYTSQTGPGDAPMLPGSGPAPTGPGAPGTPAASNVAATSATLSWTAATPGTNPVAGYDVYRVGSPDTVVASVTGLSATVTGLSPSTAYQFYVKAKDSTGLTGPASGTVSLTTAASGGSSPPGAPGTPTASNVTASSATLSWTAASAGTNAIAGYQVFEVGNPDTVVASTNSGTLTATVSGLTAGTQYGFYVKAKDSAGTLGAASGTTTVTTASQPPPGGAKVAYAVQSDWGSGFSASVTITNTGSTAINGWTLGFAFAGNQQVGSGWSANWSQSGHSVTATSQSFNGTIAPGASVQIGFTGSYSGTNAAPTAFTVNGQPAALG